MNSDAALCGIGIRSKKNGGIITDTTKLYNRVYSEGEISERDFVRVFNDCARYLLNKFGEEYVIESDGVSPTIERVGDASAIFDNYFGAIFAALMFKLTGEQTKREEFLVLSTEAYCSLWKEKIKNRRIRGRSF